MPRQDVEQGCLARAIRADQPQQLSLLHVHARAVDGAQSTETFFDGGDLQQCHQAPPDEAARRRATRPRASPHSPARKKRANTNTSRANTNIWMLPTSRSNSEAT